MFAASREPSRGRRVRIKPRRARAQADSLVDALLCQAGVVRVNDVQASRAAPAGEPARGPNPASPWAIRAPLRTRFAPTACD